MLPSIFTNNTSTHASLTKINANGRIIVTSDRSGFIRVFLNEEAEESTVDTPSTSQPTRTSDLAQVNRGSAVDGVKSSMKSLLTSSLTKSLSSFNRVFKLQNVTTNVSSSQSTASNLIPTSTSTDSMRCAKCSKKSLLDQSAVSDAADNKKTPFVCKSCRSIIQ